MLVLNYWKEKLKKPRKNLDTMNRNWRNKAKKLLILVRKPSRKSAKKSISLVTENSLSLFSKVKFFWILVFHFWKVLSKRFKNNWATRVLQELIQVIKRVHQNSGTRNGALNLMSLSKNLLRNLKTEPW